MPQGPAPRVRFGAFFAAAIPYGIPKFDALPSSIRNAAQDAGFRPICFMWWGHWPFPMMPNTPQFMGPEGFVKLEAYQGKRFYMRTLFTDGTAISTSNNPKGNGNLRTTHIDSVVDFGQDYVAHLEAVRATTCKPSMRARSRCYDSHHAIHADCPSHLAFSLLTSS